LICSSQLIWIKVPRSLAPKLGKTAEGGIMGVHQWARRELESSLERAQELGFDPLLSLRALLSEAVELNRLEREVADLAQELEFLADNLDPQRDYAFMRP
jgi:hypothetical protein